MVPAGASLTGHHYNYSVVLYRSTWYRLELPLQATIITILLCSIGAHGTGWSFPQETSCAGGAAISSPAAYNSTRIMSLCTLSRD